LTPSANEQEDVLITRTGPILALLPTETSRPSLELHWTFPPRLSSSLPPSFASFFRASQFHSLAGLLHVNESTDASHRNSCLNIPDFFSTNIWLRTLLRSRKQLADGRSACFDRSNQIRAEPAWFSLGPHLECWNPYADGDCSELGRHLRAACVPAHRTAPAAEPPEATRCY
jgi:hypothetical protein